MSLDQAVARAEGQAAGGVLNPLVIVRMGELQHRKAGGQKPDCVKLSPDFYAVFMQAYKTMKALVKRDDPDVADQIDMERPHVLGIPIICEHGARSDIEYYVPAGRTSKDLPLIIVP
jgi:hypothetical protein